LENQAQRLRETVILAYVDAPEFLVVHIQYHQITLRRPIQAIRVATVRTDPARGPELDTIAINHSQGHGCGAHEKLKLAIALTALEEIAGEQRPALRQSIGNLVQWHRNKR